MALSVYKRRKRWKFILQRFQTKKKKKKIACNMRVCMFNGIHASTVHLSDWLVQGFRFVCVFYIPFQQAKVI